MATWNTISVAREIFEHIKEGNPMNSYYCDFNVARPPKGWI
jgi:hypothetical protein